ncbi:tetrahydrobiopterin biosynthesis enzymes-like protein [Wolfiporia cocos MD-104 SS10]|uniref:dihydroneopterin aldolase n=1 Tax=Wolfiporia cocos (strain MD-104) TaxID=742152 RepID=A0A2H3JYG9_WOLCO|nr:tetrahydrobiopterin biosynthesis enzymes-like protein [Wolfiporia cocos MD-104 SS10]
MNSSFLRPDVGNADIVFIDSIEVSANIGADWWGRNRPQPLAVSVYLCLPPRQLDRAGATDDVRDTVHYGHICKSITEFVENTHKANLQFEGPFDFSRKIAQLVSGVSVRAASQIHVRIASSKIIPLANNIMFDATYTDPIESYQVKETVQVSIEGLVLSVIIGVNSPERVARQRVIINFSVREFRGHQSPPVDYQALVATITKTYEASSYLTLEKFVYEMLRLICLTSPSVESATVRAEKPSALAFARTAGVQMTRTRASFV